MQVDEKADSLRRGGGDFLEVENSRVVDENIHHYAVGRAEIENFVGGIGLREVAIVRPEPLVGMLLGESVASSGELLHLVANHQNVDAHRGELTAKFESDAA